MARQSLRDRIIVGAVTPDGGVTLDAALADLRQEVRYTLTDEIRARIESIRHARSSRISPAEDALLDWIDEAIGRLGYNIR